MLHVKFNLDCNLLHLQDFIHDFEVAEQLRIPSARLQHCLEGTFTKHIDIFTVKHIEKGTPFKRYIRKEIEQTSKFTEDITKSRQKK